MTLGLLLYVAALTAPADAANVEGDDSIRHWGAAVQVNPATTLVMDKYQRLWQKGKKEYSVAAEWHYATLPSDSDAFDADYGFPTIGVGVKYSINHGVTMHKPVNEEFWPGVQEADYDSKMGNAISVYGTFARPVYRKRRWEADYTFNIGVGYSRRKYDRKENIDNELIGAHWLIHFGAGMHVSYQIGKDWALKAGMEYWHLSNGALNRPNKGANFVGPSMALVYRPYYNLLPETGTVAKKPEQAPYWFANVTLGVGGKTAYEDWDQTQFHLDPSHPDYRTGHFKRYMAYSLQADCMRRYARRWASGAGVDFFYGSYAGHVERLEHDRGIDSSLSPWSVGVALKHQAYFHQISMSMALGAYVYRKMGENAKVMEKPYYERIGVLYAFPRLGGLSVGAYVKAHLTKADYTELVVAMPVRLH